LLNGNELKSPSVSTFYLLVHVAEGKKPAEPTESTG